MSAARRSIPSLVVALGLAAAASACGGTGSHTSAGTDGTATTSAPATTAAPSTTSTTVDPGTLPQTDEKPVASGAVFDAHMKGLADAIINDDVLMGTSSFFPVEAYKQTKKNTNPAADWQNRLIANFRVDVADAHKKLGPNAKSAVFKGVEVPNTAVWVKPGEEYNVGPYWRVFKSQMLFDVNGSTVKIPIESMISWRGQWYVVHLGTIR